MDDCIFCRIVAGEIPTEIIASNDGAIAFADINPVTPEHLLVIPRRHITHLDAMTEDDRGSLADCMELIRDAAPTHKHLYVEKPLGVTAAAAQEAAELLRGRAALFHAGYHLREVPAHLALADLVRRGRIGELVRLRGRFTHGGLPGGIFREHAWMLDPARAGWGALGDLGVHLVDLLSLVADSPVVSVTAHVQPPRHAGRVDPWGEAMLRFDSGVIASVAAGWCEHGGPLVIEAFGSAGAAVAEGGALRVDPPGVLDAPLPDPVEPRAGAALDHFFAAIGGDSAAPLVSPDEAAAHCRILEAIYLAAGSERWVDLEEIKSCPAG